MRPTEYKPMTSKTPSATAEYDAWFRAQVQAGIDAANAGDVIPAEVIEAKAATWRAELTRPQQDALRREMRAAGQRMRKRLAARHSPER